MTKDQNGLLCASFYTDARLIGTLKDVERSLSTVPNLAEMSNGTNLKYKLTDGSKKGLINAIIELGHNRITFTYYFTKPSKHNSNINLIAFLSILAYLNGLYDVPLSSLYSTLTEAISSASLMLKEENGSGSPMQMERIDSLSKSNIVLSHEIKKVSDRRSKLESEISVYKAFCVEAVEKFSRGRIDSPSDISDALTRLGIDSELASEVEKLLTIELKDKFAAKGVVK